MYNNYLPQNYYNTQPYNPYAQRLNTMQQDFQPKQEIIKVNGENGAKAYNMPPNSSILLLDETAPLIWFKSTDGAGYPTLTPYTIAPYQAEPQIDTKSLEQRVSKLEELLNEQSNTKNVKSKHNNTTTDDVNE